MLHLEGDEQPSRGLWWHLWVQTSCWLNAPLWLEWRWTLGGSTPSTVGALQGL